MLDCCRDACCLINGGLIIKQTGQGRHLQCLSQNTDRAQELLVKSRRAILITRFHWYNSIQLYGDISAGVKVGLFSTGIAWKVGVRFPAGAGTTFRLTFESTDRQYVSVAVGIK
jgi:hypothetical protein